MRTANYWLCQAVQKLLQVDGIILQGLSAVYHAAQGSFHETWVGQLGTGQLPKPGLPVLPLSKPGGAQRMATSVKRHTELGRDMLPQVALTEPSVQSVT